MGIKVLSVYINGKGGKKGLPAEWKTNIVNFRDLIPFGVG